VTSARWIGRVVRPLVLLGGVVPGVVLVERFLRDDLGANPAEKLEHFTGTTALVILLLCLAVTPLRRLTGVNALIRLRKPIGLWSFAYACVHFSCYLVFDQSLDLHEILRDIVKRPYITVGFTAFLLLLSLALTSSTWSVRKLGARGWGRLHALIYPAAGLGVIHYLWSVKRDVTVPVTLDAILVFLLATRLWRGSGGGMAPPAAMDRRSKAERPQTGAVRP
jgi:sulfoxide reductase heme-binding subunit YedZ